MKRITQRDMIRGVLERWRRQYSTAPAGSGPDSVGNALARLDLEAASADEVNAVIGNDTWTSLRCDECGNGAPVVVRLGEEPDYDSRTVELCPACLADAAKLALSDH